MPTELVLLSRSRKLIEQFMKTYLHRAIKTLHFLSGGEFEKCLTKLQNILAFLTFATCKLSRAYLTKDFFLHVVPVFVIVL